MKKLFKKILASSSLLLFIFSFYPSVASAIIISAEKSSAQAKAGDVVLVKISVDTEGKEINAIEGSLEVVGAAKIVSINTGGSVFSLWPNKPSVSGNKISFVGGTPNGVYGKSLRLFNVALELSSPGTVSMKLKETSAFLNDGKGTKISATGSEFSINSIVPKDVRQNDVVSLLLEDKNPPLPFKIELGQDKNSYGGKYFLSFYATDAESGIDTYEVSEGKLPPVRSGSVYILRDQTLSSKIEVSAIDNAGNVRTQTFGSNGWLNRNTLTILFVLILVSLFIFLFYKFRKNRAKKI